MLPPSGATFRNAGESRYAGFLNSFDALRTEPAPPIESPACRICSYGPLRAAQIASHDDLFRQLDLTVWGHISDGNIHPNIIPRRAADIALAREALLEAGRAVIALGGSPLAEHGVGRHPLKQQLLELLHGPGGIAAMRAVKQALDPAGRLAPGVLLPHIPSV